MPKSSKKSKSRNDETVEIEEDEEGVRVYNVQSQNSITDKANKRTGGKRSKTKKKSSKNKKAPSASGTLIRDVLFCAGMLVFVAGIIVAVLFATEDEENAGGESGDTSLGNYAGTDNLAKQLVDGLCQDKATCGEVCGRFWDCCDVYADMTLEENAKKTVSDMNGTTTTTATRGNTSTISESEIENPATCYNNHIGMCYSYSKCHSLRSDVDPAPVKISQICSMGVIGVDRRLCENVCEDVKCCWDPEHDESGRSCLDTDFHVCVDYAYCQNLRTNNLDVDKKFHVNYSVIPVAPVDLDESCKEKAPACTRACSMVESCCVNPNSDCYRNNFLACLSYVGCNYDSNSFLDLKVSQFRSRLPPPPSNLNNMCQHTHEDPVPCRDTCHDYNATCCWTIHNETNNVYNCFGDDPLGCLNYQSCKVLAPHQLMPEAVNSANPADQGSLEELEEEEAKVRDSDNFPLSKAYVDDVCDALAIFTDREPCEIACEPFSYCCDPFEIADSSCFEEDVGGCFSYSKCHALRNRFTSPNYVLPSILPIQTACTPEAILRDRQSCANLCSPAACCWDPEADNCLALNFAVCMDYAFCDNLRVVADELTVQDTQNSAAIIVDEEANKRIAVGPPDLDAHCADGGQNNPTCYAECSKVVECCTNKFSKCFRENFISCLSYASCPGISSDLDPLVSTMNSVVPPAAPDVKRNCGHSWVDRGGGPSCEAVCQVASCCFDNDPAVNCFGADPLGCLQYARCGVLQKNRQPTFKALRHEVETVCTSDIMQSSAVDIRRPCEQICAPTLNGCCDPYAANETAICFHDEMPGCYAHSRCHVLSGRWPAPELPQIEPRNGEVDVVTNRFNIFDVCDLDAMNEHSSYREECERLCEPMRCCWDDAGSQPCLHSRFMQCMDYMPCQSLRNSTAIDIHNGVATHRDKTLQIANKNLDELCANGEDECYVICAGAGRCCNHPYGDCYRDNFLSCLSYSTCVNYFGVNLQVAEAHSVIARQVNGMDYDVCDESYIARNGRDLCEEVCEPASCCWVSADSEEDGNCFGSDPLGCMQFLQCRVLWKNWNEGGDSTFIETGTIPEEEAEQVITTTEEDLAQSEAEAEEIASQAEEAEIEELENEPEIAEAQSEAEAEEIVAEAEEEEEEVLEEEEAISASP